jgi:tRNA-specific adenosine deaminase 1
MNALSLIQSIESYELFESGKNKRKRAVENPFLVEYSYANKQKKLKMTENDQQNKPFERGRFDFNQIGILRTKPGQLNCS